MTMYGADAEQLELLAASLATAAGELDSLQRNLGARVRTVGWPGRDGDRFRQQWTGSLSPTLLHTRQQLETAASLLRRNADEQRRASLDVAAGPFIPGVGPAGPVWPGGPGLPWPPGAPGAPWLPGLPPIIGLPGYPGLPFPLLPGIDLGDVLRLFPQLGGVSDYAIEVAGHVWDGIEGIDGLLDVNRLSDLADWDTASSAFGLLSSAAWLTGQFFDDGTAGRLLGEGGGHALAVAAAGSYLMAGAPVATTTLGRAAPFVGIGFGVLDMGINARDIYENGLDVDNGLGLASGGLMTAGSVAMLIPGGQVVGGALILTGSAIEAGQWVHENWDDIEGYLSDGAMAVAQWGLDAADAVTDFGGDVLQGAGQALDTAGDVIEDVGSVIEDTASMVDDGLDAIGDGLGALGEGLGGLFG